jgi:hypothetical protein
MCRQPQVEGTNLNVERCYRSASEASRLFATQQDSRVELMKGLLELAEWLSPVVNATTAIHPEAALAAARVAITEEMAVAGWHKTMGSRQWDEVPDAHHPVVDKLLAAGAIPHIQTTVPEFCLIPQTLVAADIDLTRERTVNIGGTRVDSYLGWVGAPPFADEVVFRVAYHHAKSSAGDLYTRTFPTMQV